MTFLTTNAVNHESTRQTRIEMFRGDSRLPWDVDRPPRVASTYRLFDTFAPESYVSSMSIPPKSTRLRPCCHKFVEKTASEKENLFYGFSVNGDEVFAVKHTRTPTAYLRISTMSARCWRKC